MPRVAIFIVFSIFVEFELGTEGGIEPPTSLASAPPTELHRSIYNHARALSSSHPSTIFQTALRLAARIDFGFRRASDFHLYSVLFLRVDTTHPASAVHSA